MVQLTAVLEDSKSTQPAPEVGSPHQNLIVQSQHPTGNARFALQFICNSNEDGDIWRHTLRTLWALACLIPSSLSAHFTGHPARVQREGPGFPLHPNDCGSPASHRASPESSDPGSKLLYAGAKQCPKPPWPRGRPVSSSEQ